MTSGFPVFARMLPNYHLVELGESEQNIQHTVFKGTYI